MKEIMKKWIVCSVIIILLAGVSGSFVSCGDEEFATLVNTETETQVVEETEKEIPEKLKEVMSFSNDNQEYMGDALWCNLPDGWSIDDSEFIEFDIIYIEKEDSDSCWIDYWNYIEYNVDDSSKDNPRILSFDEAVDVMYSVFIEYNIDEGNFSSAERISNIIFNEQEYARFVILTDGLESVGVLHITQVEDDIVQFLTYFEQDTNTEPIVQDYYTQEIFEIITSIIPNDMYWVAEDAEEIEESTEQPPLEEISKPETTTTTSQGNKDSTFGRENVDSNRKNEKRYVAGSNTNKFHNTDCHHAKKIEPGTEIYFSSRDDAIRRGYVPCKVCDP